MPDPGEPHRPEPGAFDNENDYLEALLAWTAINQPVADERIHREATQGIVDLETMLGEHSERGSSER